MSLSHLEVSDDRASDSLAGDFPVVPNVDITVKFLAVDAEDVPLGLEESATPQEGTAGGRYHRCQGHQEHFHQEGTTELRRRGSDNKTSFYSSICRRHFEDVSLYVSLMLILYSLEKKIVLNSSVLQLINEVSCCSVLTNN